MISTPLWATLKHHFFFRLRICEWNLVVTETYNHSFLTQISIDTNLASVA